MLRLSRYGIIPARRADRVKGERSESTADLDAGEHRAKLGSTGSAIIFCTYRQRNFGWLIRFAFAGQIGHAPGPDPALKGTQLIIRELAGILALKGFKNCFSGQVGCLL